MPSCGVSQRSKIDRVMLQIRQLSVESSHTTENRELSKTTAAHQQDSGGCQEASFQNLPKQKFRQEQHLQQTSGVHQSAGKTERDQFTVRKPAEQKEPAACPP